MEELPASQYERNAWDPMTDEEVEVEASANAAVEMRKPAEQSLADALKDDMEVRPHPNPNPSPHTDPSPSPSPSPSRALPWAEERRALRKAISAACEI